MRTFNVVLRCSKLEFFLYCQLPNMHLFTHACEGLAGLPQVARVQCRRHHKSSVSLTASLDYKQSYIVKQFVTEKSENQHTGCLQRVESSVGGFLSWSPISAAISRRANNLRHDVTVCRHSPLQAHPNVTALANLHLFWRVVGCAVLGAQHDGIRVQRYAVVMV